MLATFLDIFINTGYFINKVELAIGSTVYISTLFKEINSDEYFDVSEDSQNHLLYWLLHLERFLYQRVGVYSIPWTVFSTKTRSGKPMFSSFASICLTQICFSVRITNSSLNFTCFALFRHEIFDDKPLFKPGALFMICHHFK